MNPFLQNAKLNVIQVFNTQGVPVKREDGMILKHRTFTDTYFQDKVQGGRLYRCPDKNMDDLIFRKLKPSGRDLLLYITYHLEKDKDTIDLTTSKVSAVLDITRQTMYTALADLGQHGLITKRAGAEYWVNPLYIFNGNRIQFIETYYPECLAVVAKQATGLAKNNKITSTIKGSKGISLRGIKSTRQ